MAQCAQITDLAGLVFSLLNENERNMYTLIDPTLTLLYLCGLAWLSLKRLTWCGTTRRGVGDNGR